MLFFWNWPRQFILHILAGLTPNTLDREANVR